MPGKDSSELLEEIRRIMADPSTRWSELPPSTSGELIAVVYSVEKLRRVVRLEDGGFFVITDEGITAKAAAQVLIELPRTVRGPLPDTNTLTLSFAFAIQAVYIFDDEKDRFTPCTNPITPLPMEQPPAT